MQTNRDNRESGRRTWGRDHALWASMLVVALLAALAAAPSSAGTPDSESGVGLGDGKLGDYVWSIKAKRPEGPAGAGPKGAKRPCLVVGTTWQSGQFDVHRSKYRQCADDAGLTSSGPPLLASGMQPSTGAAAEMTAVGMIFAPAARRVSITLDGGERETIPLQILNPAQAGVAGLRRFRYAAFAVRGTWCAERLVSQDASGRPLWDSGLGTYTCE